MKKQSILARVVCDNYICDQRGDYTSCYLNTGSHTYKLCDKHKFYARFQQRHNYRNRDE